jgi:hypothetical protein
LRPRTLKFLALGYSLKIILLGLACLMIPDLPTRAMSKARQLWTGSRAASHPLAANRGNPGPLGQRPAFNGWAASQAPTSRAAGTEARDERSSGAKPSVSTERERALSR